jgi:hypothetical protein
MADYAEPAALYVKLQFNNKSESVSEKFLKEF